MLEKIKKIDPLYIIIPMCVLVSMWVVWAFTGMWPQKGNPYNSYTLQACSWLDGNFHLVDGPNLQYLELAIFNGKYFVSFPPFPSYIMLPFAMIFGKQTPDNWIAVVTSVIGAVYAVKLCKKMVPAEKHTAFFVLYLLLANGLMFVSVNGFVWFIAQNMCFTLSLMSLYYAACKKGGLSLALWACAVGCRPTVVLYFPLLLYILLKGTKKEDIKKEFIVKKIIMCIPMGIIALSYMILNYARFGSITEFGHNYLPEFTRTTTGQFNIAYLGKNLDQLLTYPSANPENHVIQFATSDGSIFWITVPILLTMIGAWIYAVVKKRKEQKVMLIMLPLLMIGHLMFICLHRTLGGWQFGNRYLLDMLPYGFYGLLLFKPEKDWFAKINMPLFYLGLLLNFVGSVVAYNHWM